MSVKVRIFICFYGYEKKAIAIFTFFYFTSKFETFA